MTDYIRKAVELADGFDLTENQLTFPSGHYFTVDSEMDIRDWMMDCVAAQLVRQVDALGAGYECWWLDADTCLVLIPGQETVKVVGANRTMNTIKAIVDSGVLND